MRHLHAQNPEMFVLWLGVVVLCYVLLGSLCVFTQKPEMSHRQTVELASTWEGVRAIASDSPRRPTSRHACRMYTCMCVCLHLFLSLSMYIYIYIHINRERERETMYDREPRRLRGADS